MEASSVADARQVLKGWLANSGEGQQPAAERAGAARQQRAARLSLQPVELLVSAPGKLGLSLGAVDSKAGPQLLQVVGVAAGGAAEQAAGAGQLRAGLVVAAVMGQPVDGVAPSAVMQLIKAAERPLSLMLRPHPDDEHPTAVSPAPEGEVAPVGPLVVLSDLVPKLFLVFLWQCERTDVQFTLGRGPLHTDKRCLKQRASRWSTRTFTTLASVCYPCARTIAQLTAESVDVLYVGRHVADFQAMPASILVNQFVGESCVTSKLLIQEMLLRNAHAALGKTGRPPWLPEQFIVPDQTDRLLTAWDRSAAASEDAPAAAFMNAWIVRSGWGARSEGVWVSDQRVKLAELCDTAAKDNHKWIVSRYISQPALVDSRKFDLRFYVAVRKAAGVKTAPEVYIHREFYCRRAIDPWGTGTAAVQSREQSGSDSGAGAVEFKATEHLTVHCYAEEEAVRSGQVFYSAAEFRSHWAEEHGMPAGASAHLVFGAELRVIRRAIAELFSCAAREMGDPELWPSSRGLYGIDVMLERPSPHSVTKQSAAGPAGRPEYLPVILEANYSPDATRILQYHSSFYDEMFECLFLDGGKGEAGGGVPGEVEPMLLPLSVCMGSGGGGGGGGGGCVPGLPGEE